MLDLVLSEENCDGIIKVGVHSRRKYGFVGLN
jgi:hypothetical protein